MKSKLSVQVLRNAKKLRILKQLAAVTIPGCSPIGLINLKTW